MKKVEIKCNLDLTEKQSAQIDLHSFHNLMTILFGELQFLGAIMGEKALFKESLDVCDELLKSIDNRSRAETILGNWPANGAGILKNIQDVISTRPTSSEHAGLLAQSRANVERILEVVDERVKEYLDRMQTKDGWRLVSLKIIELGLKRVLEAMAQNSRGRYNVVFDRDLQGRNDYLVDLTAVGRPDGRILVPLVMIDVLRDLTANARKYTAPGGVIRVSLIEGEGELKLTVSDNGRGIPEDDLDNVVRFGFRGSNVAESEARGGGYGLTKAYWVCRNHQGRMWIESEPNKGTTIDIILPRPK
ncbi:MAG: ATP-binding protein [Pseudomonadota bacterium]